MAQGPCAVVGCPSVFAISTQILGPFIVIDKGTRYKSPGRERIWFYTPPPLVLHPHSFTPLLNPSFLSTCATSLYTVPNARIYWRRRLPAYILGENGKAKNAIEGKRFPSKNSERLFAARTPSSGSPLHAGIVEDSVYPLRITIDLMLLWVCQNSAYYQEACIDLISS